MDERIQANSLKFKTQSIILAENLIKEQGTCMERFMRQHSVMSGLSSACPLHVRNGTFKMKVSNR